MGAQTRRKDHQHTQRTMRKQIQETAEHRADTEKRIMEHNLEIRRLEEGERSLSRNFENRAKPLAVSEARYNLRRRRSTREDCHDEVEDALLREVMELQAGVADMQVRGTELNHNARTHARTHPDDNDRGGLSPMTLSTGAIAALFRLACSPQNPAFRCPSLCCSPSLSHTLSSESPVASSPGCVCTGGELSPSSPRLGRSFEAQ